MDWSAGVMVWVEDPGDANQNIVRRMDFTVDSSGNVSVESPVTILPMAGEEPLAGDQLSYGVGNVWGDATHNSLYITVRRFHYFNSGPNAGAASQSMSIYDLNTLTNVNDSPDVRTITNKSHASDGSLESFIWLDAGDPSTLPDCFNVPYPHFVPTCNTDSPMHFNPSGTRLYFGSALEDAYRTSNSEQWGTAMRIDIDKETAGPNLVDWIIGAPEIVYSVKYESGVETGGELPRPDTNRYALPSPEYILMGQNDGTNFPTKIFQMFLNADQCADLFAPNASGLLDAPTDLWESCKDESTFNFYTWDLPHGAYHWESPEALLMDSYQQRIRPGLFDIRRIYVSGALAGTVQLVLEHAEGADTGY